MRSEEEKNKLSKTPSQLNPSSSTMKKKTFDFPDHHYRDAISRLKTMLSDSYLPVKYASSSSIFKSVTDDETDTTENTIVERPAFKEVSKYFPYKPYSTYSNISSVYGHNRIGGMTSQPSPCYKSDAVIPIGSVQPPNELLNYIERQESYIEQLEKESVFCRDELSSLMTKVKDVISENETLSEVQDDGCKPYTSKFNVTSGPNILFESRISELEAQLAQISIDYKKLTDENAELKRKRAMSDSSVDVACSDAYKKQIENLQRDKSALEEMVKKLQKQVTGLKELDSQVFTSSQRNRDLTEQANFERVQNDIEIRRLKDELERQHERIRELQTETAKRIAEERSNTERRYNYQVDQLGGDLTSQWEHSSKLQLELERMKRAESDFKRELASKLNTIEELKGEIKMKTTAHLSDMAQTNSEKHSLEQEITNLRMQLERIDRSGKTEVSRLNAENSSLRQRLDRADADLLHSRRENLRLCDQISNLEKEIALGDIDKDHRPKDVKTVIGEMEDKHAKTVQELESMISEQRQLMEKLTDQCKNLTEKLEDTSSKHKEEINSIQTSVEYLTNRITSASSVIAASNNNFNVNEAYQTSINSSNVGPSSSSPKNYDAFSYSTPSMPQAEVTYVEDNSNNYSISNDMLPYEQTTRVETPPKRNSIKNPVNDDEYEAPSYYNEPPTHIEQQPAVTNIQPLDSAEWNRASNASFYPPTSTIDNFQQQQQSAVDYGQIEYEKHRDSRPQSRSSSRAGSRNNSRPSSRPMSRASSQQRFYEDTNEYSQQQQQQPRSLSRNDSQRSITEYPPQRQPEPPLITTRIEESYTEAGMDSARKPSVTFKSDEYEQQSQNIQQMAEQRSPFYTPQQQQQQQYEEQPSYQPQPTEYDNQQNMGYTYDQQQYTPTQQYEQPIVEPKYYQPESRRQSPENTYQQMQGYTSSRRQSPEQEYQPYVEPQTPKRASPPKTPTREQSREELDKVIQQRQQSREQLYGRNEGEEIQQVKALSSKQQSRDNLSEQPEKSPPSQNISPIPTPVPTSTISPISANIPTSSNSKSPLSPPAKQMAPPSPKRTISNASKNSSKSGAEQKAGRNAMGEATGVGRKSDSVQKQPPKVPSVRGKK